MAAVVFSLVSAASSCPAKHAQREPTAEADPGAKSKTKSSSPTRGTPTLGGWVFWTDLLLYDDWRIQRHALTGHCRLLVNHARRPL